MKRNNLFDQHTLDICNAAMPHIHPRAQNGINVLLKANDLMSSLSSRGGNGELSTMDLQNWKPDPEEMLMSIKGVLNNGETEVVDMLLNFMKARRIYSAYESYNDTMLQAQSVGGNGGNGGNGNGNGNRRNPFGMNNQRNNRMNNSRNNNSNNNSGQSQTQPRNNNAQAKAMGGGDSNNQMPNFMNFMMSQLNPEQRKTFEMFNQMMTNMPQSGNGKVSGQNVSPQENDEGDIKMQSVANEEQEVREQREGASNDTE